MDFVGILEVMATVVLVKHARGIMIPNNLPPGVSLFMARVSHIETLKMKGIFLATNIDKNTSELTLLLPDYWDTLPDAVKVEWLAHEAGHWYFGHHIRRQGRHLSLWGQVTDACLYHTKAEELEVSVKYAVEYSDVPTFERLGIPPCPAEIAYEMLKGNASNQFVVCNSFLYLDTNDSQIAELVSQYSFELAMEIGFMSGSHLGPGRPMPQDQDAIPPWIYKAIEFLSKEAVRKDRERSWRRDHRFTALLPGRVRKSGLGCLILQDASGSMGEKETAMFYAAISQTPELEHSEVAVFDNTVRGPISVRDHIVKEHIEQAGGGTLFKVAAKLRDHRPVIWLTDGYPNDGWPEPWPSEVWVITTDVEPPHGVVVHATN